MKKIKVLLLVLCFGLVLTLSSCDFFEDSSRSATDVIYTNIYEFQSEVTDVISKVEKSTVGIQTHISATTSSLGSGVIYKKEESQSLLGIVSYKYSVVTNFHVVSGYSSIQVYLGEGTFGGIYANASYVGGDEANDLAVLTFESTKEFETCTFGLDENLLKGQFVIAVGCPLGFEQFNSASFGIVSKINYDFIQHDASINPGNSGGGLFNLNGKLIGINVSKYTSTGTSNEKVSVEGIGFAIPIETVSTVISKIEAGGGDIIRPKLGITITEYGSFILTEEANMVSDSLKGGLVVVDITEGSNAERNGIEIYDVIIKADNIDTYSRNTFQEYFSEFKYGDTIVLTIDRKGETKTISITLR